MKRKGTPPLLPPPPKKKKKNRNAPARLPPAACGSSTETLVLVALSRISSSNSLPCVCIFVFFVLIFFLIHILLSRGSQRGTYLMLPSLFSAAAVALVRGARMLPGTQPSAAGEWSLAGWYTRHMFCWLMARTWTTSPWLTQISFSFSA